MVHPRTWRTHRSNSSSQRLPGRTFLRVDVDAHDAVLLSRALLRGAAKRIEAFRDANAGEPESAEQLDELCLRQSAGDSTCPEIDIAPDRLGQLACNDDVAVQEFATGLEHAEHFREGPLFV